MQFTSSEINELTSGLNRFINDLNRKFSGSLNPVNQENISVGKFLSVNDKPINAVYEITDYFEQMLGFTKNMMSNMGVMDSGFAKTVQLIVHLLGSITGSGTGSGLFGGLLGVIGGIFGGPLGAAAGTGIGTLLGSTSGMVNSQSVQLQPQSPQMINQVIIKNPVTFTKAFDVEVRTRSLRGGIDL